MDSGAYYIVASILTLIGTVFACFQLWQIKTNRKKQFAQARREKTVEMVTFYSKAITPETKIAEDIVASFTEEQCRALYNCDVLVVSLKLRDQICTICPYREQCERELRIKRIQFERKKKKQNEAETSTEEQYVIEIHEKRCKKHSVEEGYIIKDEVAYVLRSLAINYLNTLECVLLSWQLGVVDQSVIEEQFRFLNKKREREKAMGIFRVIAGSGQSYPAIEKFYQHLPPI